MSDHRKHALLDGLAILLMLAFAGLVIYAIAASAKPLNRPATKIVKAAPPAAQKAGPPAAKKAAKPDPKAVALSAIPKNYRELEVLRQKEGFAERERRVYVLSTVADLRWVLKYANNGDAISTWAPTPQSERRPLRPIPAHAREW